jgi:hypothetical protein
MTPQKKRCARDDTPKSAALGMTLTQSASLKMTTLKDR